MHSAWLSPLVFYCTESAECLHSAYTHMFYTQSLITLAFRARATAFAKQPQNYKKSNTDLRFWNLVLVATTCTVEGSNFGCPTVPNIYLSRRFDVIEVKLMQSHSIVAGRSPPKELGRLFDRKLLNTDQNSAHGLRILFCGGVLVCLAIFFQFFCFVTEIN